MGPTIKGVLTRADLCNGLRLLKTPNPFDLKVIGAVLGFAPVLVGENGAGHSTLMKVPRPTADRLATGPRGRLWPWPCPPKRTAWTSETHHGVHANTPDPDGGATQEQPLQPSYLGHQRGPRSHRISPMDRHASQETLFREQSRAIIKS